MILVCCIFYYKSLKHLYNDKKNFKSQLFSRVECLYSKTLVYNQGRKIDHDQKFENHIVINPPDLNTNKSILYPSNELFL